MTSPALLRARLRLRALAGRTARRVARRLGHDLVRADFYSPIPDTRALAEAVWSSPAPMPGLPLDLDAQLRELRASLGPHLAAFAPPRDPPGDALGVHLANFSYGPVDAALLHAFVRARRPARVLEIGAGMSTLVIAGAAAGVEPFEHRVVDPHPSAALARVADRIDLRAVGATDVPLAEFEALRAGDVLFVDTTHTLRPGGDVPYLLLEAIPSLAPGVLVHVHDVFRPYEYPRALYDEFGVAWQEHYLVQGLLAFNDRFRVVCATHALHRERARELRELIPVADAVAHEPSSFWFERVR